MAPSAWTHALCTECWRAERGGEAPTRVRPPRRVAMCCMCGVATFSGIWVRRDPASVPFAFGGTALPWRRSGAERVDEALADYVAPPPEPPLTFDRAEHVYSEGFESPPAMADQLGWMVERVTLLERALRAAISSLEDALAAGIEEEAP